jgi:hypothetical protein
MRMGSTPSYLPLLLKYKRTCGRGRGR